MKKIFSAFLAATMLCTMSSSAFAAIVNTTDPTSKDLTVEYSEGTIGQDAYAASIQWDEMKFTYNGESKQWNTDGMYWETKGEAGWSAAKNITVSNKSSQAITAMITYNLNEKKQNVTGISVTPTNATLVTGSNNTYTIAAATAGTASSSGTATTATFAVQPTGTYTVDIEAEIGSITITLT